ncbi:MAG TPA: 2-dehydro-3-deoxygalactonokinase [Trueperaceae bacterium]|nr:2-dehydro-3-deoxygalactonokinase [Trueperaceae bacterium]
MSATYAVVDSGTTTTRVRIWRGGEVVWSASRQVGAKDTAIDGSTAKVATALRELLATATAETGSEPAAIICSGMITSNMGLFELPHLAAPASPDDTARGMVQRSFPDISSVPLTFVPGVKTLPGYDGLAGLPTGDVLRGEEAEIVGLRHALGIGRESLFLHIGSHHKAIEVAPDGSILASRTAITGELLAAVIGNTILKSSVVSLDGLALEMDAVTEGFAAAREHGFGRALFLVRVGEQLAGQPRARMTSYLLGVLASLDLPLLTGAALDTPIVVYGTGAFPEILYTVLPAGGFTAVRRVDQAIGEKAAADGAVSLFERYRALHG